MIRIRPQANLLVDSGGGLGFNKRFLGGSGEGNRSLYFSRSGIGDKGSGLDYGGGGGGGGGVAFRGVVGMVALEDMVTPGEVFSGEVAYRE